jgi:hypothetical protein
MALYSALSGSQAPSGGQTTRLPSTGTPSCRPPIVPAAPRQFSAADGGHRSRKGGRGDGGSTQGVSLAEVAAQCGRHSTSLDQDHLHVAGPGPECLPSSGAGLLTAPPYGVPPTPPYGMSPLPSTPPQVLPRGQPPPPLGSRWLEVGTLPPSPLPLAPWR